MTPAAPRPAFTALLTPRLVLRRFNAGDREAFMAYRNDPEVARYQSWTSCDEEQAATFLRDQQAAEPGTVGEWFQFAIARREDEALIGDCALKTFDAGRQGEIGFTLARAHQGHGYAREAVARLLDFAFAELDFHRVYAITDTLNEPAAALLERIGFQREAHFRQHAWFKGRWADEYLYALLASEWRERADA